MPNYDSVDLNSKALHGNVYGNAVSYSGNAVLGVAPVTADKIRVCKVPAGTKVTDVILTNTDLGTTVPATLQFEPDDGSAATVWTAVDSIALGTANPNGLLVAPVPVIITKDSKLVLLCGTVSAGAAGSVSAVVNGELVGVK